MKLAQNSDAVFQLKIVSNQGWSKGCLENVSSSSNPLVQGGLAAWMEFLLQKEREGGGGGENAAAVGVRVLSEGGGTPWTPCMWPHSGSSEAWLVSTGQQPRMSHHRPEQRWWEQPPPCTQGTGQPLLNTSRPPWKEEEREQGPAPRPRLSTSQALCAWSLERLPQGGGAGER